MTFETQSIYFSFSFDLKRIHLRYIFHIYRSAQ